MTIIRDPLGWEIEDDDPLKAVRAAYELNKLLSSPKKELALPGEAVCPRPERETKGYRGPATHHSFPQEPLRAGLMLLLKAKNSEPLEYQEFLNLSGFPRKDQYGFGAFVKAVRAEASNRGIDPEAVITKGRSEGTWQAGPRLQSLYEEMTGEKYIASAA